MNAKRCLIHNVPDVHYNPVTTKWTVACPCTARVCEFGHNTYAEALTCYNSLVVSFEVA